MSLQYRPLSIFGRRLLGLFVGCALVPVGVVALIAFSHVRQQLDRQTQVRLEQAGKAMAGALFERLLLLDATLKSIPSRAVVQLSQSGGRPQRVASPVSKRAKPANESGIDGRVAFGGVVGAGSQKSASAPKPAAATVDANRTLIAGLDLLARRRFTALEFVRDDGRRIAIAGQVRSLPPLSPKDSAHLRLGRALLHQERTGGETRLYLLRRLDRRGEVRGTFVGEISRQYLWGALEQGLPSATTAVNVVDDSGRSLFGSTERHKSPKTSALPIALGDVFASPDWTLVLSESMDEVMAPMDNFSQTFLIVVLLSIAGVLVLSASQIRRSLVPLRELQEATRRVAQRDFARRVTVTSRDEFAELAASFNTMAAQLGRQFTALATAAEIDRAVLSATDASAIVDTVLGRMRDIVPCSAVSVTLVAGDGSKSAISLVQDYVEERRRRPARVEVRAEDVQALLAGSEVFHLVAGSDLAPYLNPLYELGSRSFVVLPLAYQRQLCGVIALGQRDDASPTEDDLLQVRRVADQAAVALANARMLAQVRELAYFDSLTGLPNRLSYKERLAGALEQAARHERMVAAFFIDLDHFSRINDTLGHEVGDQLLQHVAARLRACCRERDDTVAPAEAAIEPDVARLGGDEFTVIMPGLKDPEDAAKLARRIISSFAQPVRLGEHEVFVNASIGIAIYPFDGEDLDTLLMHADTAMYKAKEQGGSSYQTYSRSMTASAVQRLTLDNDLRRALDREEFQLYYQPIVDARGGAIVGAEALIRWRHPDLGLLLPSEFIQLAEENGLIIPIGEWVMQTACVQNGAWQGAGFPPIRVSVNLSSRQLKRSLPDTVSRILRTTGLAARYLGLELTESMLVNHSKEGVDALQTLRSMGLHLSVDDFGTGYSSFSYLKHFPLDALKIDRSFVRELTVDHDDAAITTAIIAMGHALELKVVAEGVETEGHRALLRDQGCDEMQGYLFGRPVESKRFGELLARGPVSAAAAGGRARAW